MSTLLQTIIPVDSLVVNAPLTFGELVKEGNINQILDNALTWSIELIIYIFVAILIFIIGRFIISKIVGFFNRVISKSSWDTVLKGFLRTVLQTFLYAVLFMIIINAVGVKTVSIAAIIASVGLAIGLAMKDNLANFAGGVMILLSKPFKGGDYITTQNLEGTVESIGILHTILRTGDNKTVYIPNGPLSTGNIINNRSMDGTLRTVIVINVDYGSNIDEVKSLLKDIAGSHPKVLKQPSPFARMTKINPTSLEFTVRVWAKSSDLWEVNHDLTELFYKKLYDKGMISSLQQVTVHMANTQS
ncbi:MAG TPA: mechanosensitive ion channel [Fermentimonas caenicola]|jgi:small conductance mechanosensitive channel|uniref:mechanosensitive ion channel family protein n=1 Tax=Lascolabacillus sp. TaxID=1924068 RepID=UPI0017AB037C|nr:mechanosensitive ion channel domain-containing protein [Lascolabacillus sp.]MDD3657180.1 mechanosensitive ion channel [Lascolabacillus sp.]HHU40844.1 mechanosensitive ion channel [Fermentimonas caenicola]